MTIQLIEDDCRAALRRLIDDGVRVHSTVTDPPYLLESILRRFGKDGSAPPPFGRDGLYRRLSRGFQGKKWDGADADGVRIPQDPTFWRLIYDILLPGGYVLAFSSPRTGHWQACAMEQAGFIMHPFIGWAYGQGWPKAHSVSKAIDKAAGAQRRVVSEGRTVRRLRPGADQISDGSWEKLDDRTHTFQITEAATPEAEDWEGWYYGAQSLKPALEPIYMAQKPFDQKNGFLNVLEHGTGAINIDACRVESDGDALGRWPANLLHDGSPDVLEVFPRSRGQQNDVKGSEPSAQTHHVYKARTNRPPTTSRDDDGSAARFFNAFPLDARSIIYCPKATTQERIVRCLICGQRFAGRPTCGCVDLVDGSTPTTSHPTVKPLALMRWLCRLVTPPGGIVLDPFAGSGTTGQAARNEGFASILIEREAEYVEDIRCRLGFSTPTPADVLALLGIPTDVEFLL